MQNLVNDGITEECHVVYLLACIRKILEQENQNSDFKLLKFYSDWALHTKLQGDTAQNILSYFNNVHSRLLNDDDNLPAEIQDVSKFYNLIEGVKKFLESHSVSVPEHTSLNSSKFISLYASIIEDCPLIINPHISRDSQITKVTVKVEFAKDVHHDQQYYKVRWVITDAAGNDGELYIINSFDV